MEPILDDKGFPKYSYIFYFEWALHNGGAYFYKGMAACLGWPLFF